MSIDFLSRFWPEEAGFYGEFRLFRGAAREQAFIPLAKSENVAATLAKMVDLDSYGWDIYFGVLPRKEKNGTASGCDTVVRALWADIDAKNVGGKEAALHATLRLTTAPPSAVVDSGHGYHAYWFLRAPESYSICVPHLKGLAREVRGDHVHDQARILRVPGTHNHKDESNVLPVRLLFFDTTRQYDLTDLPRLEPQPERRGYHVPAYRTITELPGWLTSLLEQPSPVGARSEAVFRAVIWMMKYGLSEDDIRIAIYSHPAGIGEKFYSKGPDGERWLNRTLDAARAAL